MDERIYFGVAKRNGKKTRERHQVLPHDVHTTPPPSFPCALDCCGNRAKRTGLPTLSQNTLLKARSVVFDATSCSSPVHWLLIYEVKPVHFVDCGPRKTMMPAGGDLHSKGGGGLT